MSKIKPDKSRPQTLFKESTFRRLQRQGFLLSNLEVVYEGMDEALTDEDEGGIFRDTIREELLLHANLFYRRDPLVAGPIVVRINGQTKRDLTNLAPKSRKTEDVSQAAFKMPPWVESDHLELDSCSARGVLLVEKQTMWSQLVHARCWEHLNLVVVTSKGMPGLTIRRFVHRVCNQFSIPLYVLADCDTWGFFIFSVLKRGMVAPSELNPYLAVDDVRFIGARVGDEMLLSPDDPSFLLERGDSDRNDVIDQWKARIAAMRAYECFAGNGWREEFRRFIRRRSKMEIEALMHRGISWLIHEYIGARIEKQEWLS